MRDYPQVSARVPYEVKARLAALSAVTGLPQWKVLVEAVDCFCGTLSDSDRALVDGVSERILRAAS